MSSAAAEALIAYLRSLRSDTAIAGQHRFGVRPAGEHLGIAIPVLRTLARPHRRDHALALALWASGIQDARLLATFVADPPQLTSSQADRWVRDTDNWALADSLAFLVDRTPFAAAQAHAWSARRAEFVKRTAFAVMAGMAVHRKELPDAVFLDFLPVITREATDERNFVRKAVNWALRQIGKRNPRLHRAALAEAARIARLDSSAARWIAADALRELRARESSSPPSPAQPRIQLRDTPTQVGRALRRAAV
ncbi:DNA alkylation repair protein [Horticoccus luteus]|uniref:DNA alkylation repair protein n=1 Tax=Horticoccus luteus TaxID=2862869 RepID=A0A8F9TU72_9BACT|nr:DNA alkylation repair protein [Horticoccus luteus]QYM79125.1 DNA alkylation repair protein [Horticoccus luteus]